MADKKKPEPAKPAAGKPATGKSAEAPKTKTTEKTAQAPTLATTQPLSATQGAEGAQAKTQPGPDNGGYVTRDQERSWFKRICHLSWTELKRYRRNIPYSIAIHSAPALAALCIWGMMSFMKIDPSQIHSHAATHIAAYDEFPLTGETSRRVRVYFDEDSKSPLMDGLKKRFKKLGETNKYDALVRDNIMDKTTFGKYISIFQAKNMSFLFHVTAASKEGGLEYQLLTPDWVLHGDLLPPQGPFAYPNSHDAIPMRDGYIAEVAMLLNEAYKQVLEGAPESNEPLKQRMHTTISPLFNYPVHLVMNVLLYVHATLQILHVIRMVSYIVEEKESGLKTLLRTMGVSSKEYYVTHAVVYFLILTVNSLLLYAPVCIIIRFHYYGSLLLGLLAYNACMVMFGLMVSTLFSARDGIGRVIFAVGVILHLETYLTQPTFTIGRGMLTSLNFASAFHYYMASISHAAVLGLPGFPLLSDISMRMFGILALVMMVVDCLVLLGMLMYLSIVYPGGQERGAPWYFLFTNGFWSGAPRPSNLMEDQNWTRQAETGKRCIIYDGVDVESRLEAVSFECYADQVLGIYGHKNSGRSTLLRLAAMIQKPDAGSVFIMEDDMVNMDHLNIIGFMDSTTAPLFEHLNVLEHMELFARLRRSDEVEQLMAILRCLELDEYASVSTLNASMKRRLQLGLAYTGGTKIMILDQPTEGCDLYTRTMIRDFIAANKAGRTTIGIFSSASETDALCDRIALIARGYVLSCGSLDWMIETFGGFTSVLTIYPKEDYFTEALRTKLKSFFTDKLPDANIVVDVGHNFTVLVKNEMTEQIGEILATLDRAPEQWGMSYAEVQRLTVERMYSMLDHSEATEDSLKTDRAYVQDIDRILTSPRYSLFSLIGCQINVVAKRKTLFTLRFMLNLFTQMTAFALVFFLALLLMALFAQRNLSPDMDISPTNFPLMRLLGTTDAVDFASSKYGLKAEVLDPKKLTMDHKQHSEWLYQYPAPLIGIFDKDGVVDTMSMSSLRMGKLFAATLADNYRLRDKGKDLIKFKVVSMILTEKYANMKELLNIIKSRDSHVLFGMTAVEEIKMVSSSWFVWLISCFCMAFSLSLCSLFPAYESSSGVLRHMRIPSDGTPTVVYWATVAVMDLGLHLLILAIFCFGPIYYVGPPSAVGFGMIFLSWIGAFLSVVPLVYIVAAYVAIPIKVFAIVMLTLLWLPFCVVASYYFTNFSFVVTQFSLSDDSAIRTLLMFSPVHASSLLTTFVPCLTGQERYTEKIADTKVLIETVKMLLIFSWAHAPAWFILLTIASKSLRRLLSKMYYKIAITEFNEPPEFNLPKQMAIANGGDDDDISVEGNTKPGKNKTAKTGEEKGYDQLPGLKNRDIIVAKKDLERAANNTVYDNLAGDPATPHKSMMKSVKRGDKTMKSVMGKLKTPVVERTAKTTEDKVGKKSSAEVEVEPGAPLIAAHPAPPAAAMTSPPPTTAVTPPDVPSSKKKSSKPGAKDEQPKEVLPARIALVADSVKKVKPTPQKTDPQPKTDEKNSKESKGAPPPTGSAKGDKKDATAPAPQVSAKGAKDSKGAPAPVGSAKGDKKDAPAPQGSVKGDKKPAAAPVTPATPAQPKTDEKNSKESKGAPAPAGSVKREDKKEPAKPATPAPPAPAAAAPKPAEKKSETKKGEPKTDPQDKNKNAVTNMKAIEATRKDLVDDKKTPAALTPSGKTPTKADATKDTQGATPVPTPKNTSKKRSGAGRDESDVVASSTVHNNEDDDDESADSDPDDVVVVSSLCCGLGGGGARGAAGADVKAAGTAPKSDEAAKSLLPQKEQQRPYNALQTITQKLGGPGIGTGVGADGMTTMARSRLTLSLHKPNEASKQRRMVKLDAPVAAECEEDGLTMYDVYVNHKRSPQQFRLEGAIVNVKKGASVVVFGDVTTSAAMLDVLTQDAIATRGAIAVAGKAHEDARIASIRDHMALSDFLTVREHLEQTATSYGIRYLTIVDRLLELVGITDKEQWIIRDLQMPDRLLVSLCTALMNRPHLIVLDEPISALCPTSSLTMWYTLSIIRNLWGTVVMTQTRSPMEVEMLASHILLTQPRVVCDILQPYDIKQRYLTQLFVRVALRQGADKKTISAIMISQLQAREYRTEARSEEVLSFVVELASRKLNVAFKQVCGFLLNLPVSFTVSTLPLDAAFESGGR